MIDYFELLKIGVQEIDDKSTPPKFDPSDWDTFETRVFILFDSTIGKGKHRITYLLRDMALAPTDTRASTLSREDKIFWNAKHSGVVFKCDCQTGWILLVPLVQNTDAWIHFH